VNTLSISGFPGLISLTITNACNLKCEMCGQWGPEGYMGKSHESNTLPVDTWKIDDCPCRNPWCLVDIQPNGDVNFCIDFPDYTIGNIKAQTQPGDMVRGPDNPVP